MYVSDFRGLHRRWKKKQGVFGPRSMEYWQKERHVVKGSAQLRLWEHRLSRKLHVAVDYVHFVHDS